VRGRGAGDCEHGLRCGGGREQPGHPAVQRDRGARE
jgi:hypothetical protein